MGTISVALTTSRFIIPTKPEDGPFSAMNIPICVADMGMMLFGSPEEMEHFCSQTILKMAQTVFVDPDKSYVFIGMDPKNEETGLVVYTEERETNLTKEFFKRWVEISSMIFEFSIIGQKEALFTIRGHWANDRWNNIGIETGPRIHIIGENQNEQPNN